MPNQNQNTKEKTIYGVKEPDKFNVVFHNDDFTPMDFVVLILKHIFFKSESEAESLMLKVHNEGKAIVGTYSYDISMSKAAEATGLARNNGYPLRITVKIV